MSDPDIYTQLFPIARIWLHKATLIPPHDLRATMSDDRSGHALLLAQSTLIPNRRVPDEPPAAPADERTSQPLLLRDTAESGGTRKPPDCL